MSKYIIEIPDDVQYVLLNGKADNKYYTAVRPIAELEELNSDYINEHYGQLQDEAYQKGFEDGKNCIERGCKGCKWESKNGYDEPCCNCLNNYNNQYKPMPKQDDSIEVGDEVVWNNDTTLTITRVHKLDDDEWCDGMAEDGAMYGVLKSNVRKTGKHYDIASILEAMRNDR